MIRYVWLLLAFTLSFIGCEKDNERQLEGEISFLTYNIAGLPSAIAETHPVHNTPYISELVNDYDVVNVQEDFNYNYLLYKDARHPYRTPWMGPVPFGDGLNTLSKFRILDFKRVKWNRCTFSECLTIRGFSVSRIEIAKGFFVDLYNIHCNAWTDSLSLVARQKNILQIAEYIRTYSDGHAVILMGDTNCKYGRTGDNIREILALGFKDAWLELKRNGDPPAQNDNFQEDCSDPSSASCDLYDKFFYRGNEKIHFDLLKYVVEEEKFSRNGEWLSDHRPVSVRLKYTTN